MKLIKLCFLMSLLMLQTTAKSQQQKHPANAENSAIKISYIGYDVNNSNYIISVENKQAINTNIKIKWNTTDSAVFNFNSLEIKTIHLSGLLPNPKPIVVSATNYDDGWLTIYVQDYHPLPIVFKSIILSKIDNNTVKLIFNVENTNGINKYNIKLSKDGINWRIHSIIFPNTNDKKFEINIKL